MTKTCPACTVERPVEEIVCPCGYNFETGERPASDGSTAVVAGSALAVAGALISLWALAIYEPTVASGFGEAGTYNIGLLTRQLMLFLTGMGIALTGVATAAAGAIVGAIRRSRAG